MRTSKTIIFRLAAPLMAMALVAGAPSAIAGDSADITLVAGSALGGAALLFTHSEITVTVETYSETMPWPGGNHEPFRLGKPTVLYTLAHEDPVVHPTVDNLTQARAAMTQFMQPLPNLKASLHDSAMLLGFNEEQLTAAPLAPPSQFMILSNSLDKTSKAWDDFCQNVQSLNTTPGLNARGAAQSLSILRGDLTESQGILQQTEPLLAQYFYGQIYSPAKLVLTDEETKTYEVTNLNSLERAMLLAGDLISHLNQKYPTPEAAQKALGQVKAAFDAEVGPKAFDLKALQNSGAFASTTAKSMDDAYESSLYAQIPNTLAGAQASSTLDFQFPIGTTGVNMGPITTEILQPLLTQNHMLDQILDNRPENQKHWLKVNSVSSYDGLAGSDTNIIYFENFATPILKGSSFDPSEFDAALGKVYQTAMGAVATSMITASQAPATAAAGAKAPATTPATDPVTLAAQEQQANAQINSNRTQILADLKTVLGTSTAVSAVPIPDATQATQDAVTKQMTATTDLLAKLKVQYQSPPP